MNKNKSAGILLYRLPEKNHMEVLLVHPGGPYFKNKDLGSWSIPKGLIDEQEEPLLAAKREFFEELGQEIPGGKLIELTPVKQKAGKTIYAWAAEGDINVAGFRSNIFRMEYPYKSGKWIEVPENDKAEWFDTTIAKKKINPAQSALIEELLTILQNEGKIQV